MDKRYARRYKSLCPEPKASQIFSLSAHDPHYPGAREEGPNPAIELSSNDCDILSAPLFLGRGPVGYSARFCQKIMRNLPRTIFDSRRLIEISLSRAEIDEVMNEAQMLRGESTT